MTAFSRIARADAASRAYTREWLRSEPLRPTTHSRFVSGRLERWYRAGTDLRCDPTVFAAPEPPKRIVALGDAVLPGWQSLLCCGGRTSIARHRDHRCFAAEAAMLNLGEAALSYWIDGAERELVLLDGDLIRLDVSVLHASDQLSDERFCITFRRFTPTFQVAYNARMSQSKA